MNRFKSLLVACLVLGSWVARAAERPNIVVFVSDDHTWRDSSVYGSRDAATPNMARLAAAGMTFDRAFVVSPSCAPSRAALLTGLMPVRNGAEPNHAEPRAEIKKLPAYLKEQGYEVVAFGKVGHYNQTGNYGFDLVKHTGYHEDIAIPAALDWLRERKGGKPLALFVGCNWPHVPWPLTAEGHDPQKLSVPTNHVDTPATRRFRGRYLAAVQRMDSDLGQVHRLAQDKFGTNLFVLHFSDHGAQWPSGKWCLYDEGLRTPLIAVWPGRIAAGARSQAMVSLVDVLPTLVEVAGGAPPESLDGRSFAGVLLGRTNSFREHVFATHSGDGNMNVYPSRAVRDGRWKFIRNLHPEFRFTTHVTEVTGDDGNYWRSWVNKAKTDAQAAALVKRYQERPAEELYDLQADPMEMDNLASRPEHRETVTRLRGLLDAWMKEQGDTGKVFGQPKRIGAVAEETKAPERVADEP